LLSTVEFHIEKKRGDGTFHFLKMKIKGCIRKLNTETSQVYKKLGAKKLPENDHL
jgi:hypothetical protein